MITGLGLNWPTRGWGLLVVSEWPPAFGKSDAPPPPPPPAHLQWLLLGGCVPVQWVLSEVGGGGGRAMNTSTKGQSRGRQSISKMC